MDEYTTWTIDNDSTADWAIRKIAQAQAEYDRLAELAKQRKAEIDGGGWQTQPPGGTTPSPPWRPPCAPILPG